MIATLSMIGFAFGGVCGVVRLVIGPGLAERIMAMDVTLMSLMGAVVVHAAANNDPTNLSVLVVIALVGFTATIAAARFLERGEDGELR